MRRLLAAAPIAAALIAGAPAAGAETLDHMYSPGTVDVIELTLPPASLEELEADPEGDYVEGTFSLAQSGGTPDEVGDPTAPISVGVRLKGEGSFQSLAGKAAFKLKFNEFVKGHTFLGLKKMTLNNMVQDPSMIHETLAYETFRAAGVVAPRTGFAYVYVNGVDYGLHLNVETLDLVALEKHYGEFQDPPQHLYEGQFGADALPAGLDNFEVDEGDEEDLSDLEALLDAVSAEEPTAYLDRMAPVADLGQMIRMWAVEKYIAHWDGYTAVGGPNNYYLYSDPDGVFQMLPWGTDQTWTESQLGFSRRGGVMFTDCLGDEDCRALYRAALTDVAAVIEGLQLDHRVSELTELLGPWQALEAAPRRPYDEEEIEAAVAEVREFIAGRPAALAGWLENDSEEEEEEEEEPEQEQEQKRPPGHGDRPVALPGRMSGRIELDRARLARGLLLTRVGVSGAGAVEQVARIATADRPIPACAARSVSAGAGVVTLRCHLSSAARRRLSARHASLVLSTRFSPDVGPPETRTRTILLAREKG